MIMESEYFSRSKKLMISGGSGALNNNNVNNSSSIHHPFNSSSSALNSSAPPDPSSTPQNRNIRPRRLTFMELHRSEFLYQQPKKPPPTSDDSWKLRDVEREAYGLPHEFYSTTYDRLLLSLQSPLPNEQDMAITTCTVLSNDTKHALKLNKSPALLNLLLAHAGIFNHCRLRLLMEETYERGRGLNFRTFWNRSVHDSDVRELLCECALERYAKSHSIPSSSSSSSALNPSLESTEKLGGAPLVIPNQHSSSLISTSTPLLLSANGGGGGEFKTESFIEEEGGGGAMSCNRNSNERGGVASSSNKLGDECVREEGEGANSSDKISDESRNEEGGGASSSNKIDDEEKVGIDSSSSKLDECMNEEEGGGASSSSKLDECMNEEEGGAKLVKELEDEEGEVGVANITPNLRDESKSESYESPHERMSIMYPPRGENKSYWELLSSGDEEEREEEEKKKSCCPSCPCGQMETVFSKYQKEDENKTDLLLLPPPQEMESVEKIGQRVGQVGSILRNLSFDRVNAEVMGANTGILRFLLLGAHCSWSNLSQMSFDTLGNIGRYIVLEEGWGSPIESMLLSLISDSLCSPDRFRILRSLETLRELMKEERNEQVISDLVLNLSPHLLSTLLSLLTLNDIMVLIYALDTLLTLTTLGGEELCNGVLRTNGSLDTLVSLVTVEAQSYGPPGCIQMRVVETVVGGLRDGGNSNNIPDSSTSSSSSTIPPHASTPPPPPHPPPPLLSTNSISSTTSSSSPSPMPPLLHPTMPSLILRKNVLNTIPPPPHSSSSSSSILLNSTNHHHHLQLSSSSSISSGTNITYATSTHLQPLLPSSTQPLPLPSKIVLGAASHLNTTTSSNTTTSAAPTSQPQSGGVVKLNNGPIAPPTTTSSSNTPQESESRSSLPVVQLFSPTLHTPRGSLTEDGWAIAWAKGAFEEVAGSSIEQGEMYRMYSLARKNPSSLLPLDKFINCVKCTYGASIGPVIKNFSGSPLYFFDGIRPKMTSPSTAIPSNTPLEIVLENTQTVASTNNNLCKVSENTGSHEEVSNNNLTRINKTTSPILKATLSRPPNPSSPELVAKKEKSKRKKNESLKSKRKFANILNPTSSAIRSLLASKVAQRQQKKLLETDEGGRKSKESSGAKNGRGGTKQINNSPSSNKIKEECVKYDGRVNGVERNNEETTSSLLSTTEESSESATITQSPPPVLSFTGLIQNGINDESSSPELSLKEELSHNPKLKGMLVDLLERKVVERKDSPPVNGLLGSSSSSNKEIRISERGLELIDKVERNHIIESNAERRGGEGEEEEEEEKMTFYSSSEGGSGENDLLEKFNEISDLIVVPPEQLGLKRTRKDGGGGNEEDEEGRRSAKRLCKEGTIVTNGTGGEHNSPLIISKNPTPHPPPPPPVPLRLSLNSRQSGPYSFLISGQQILLHPTSTTSTSSTSSSSASHGSPLSGAQFILSKGGGGGGGGGEGGPPKAILILQPQGGGGGSTTVSASPLRLSQISGRGGTENEGTNGTKTLEQIEAEFPYLCEWGTCGERFSRQDQIQMHAMQSHAPESLTEGVKCNWGVVGCDGAIRKRFSLMTHLQDRHCTKQALELSLYRRKNKLETPPVPQQPVNHPGYAPNAAFHAIKRQALQFVPPKDIGESEGPVTKSIRLTSALILRNLCTYSHLGRQFLRRYESHLSAVAMSNVESSRTIAQLLYDMNELGC